MPWCIAVHVGVGQASSETRADNLKALMHKALRAGRTALEAAAAAAATTCSSDATHAALLDACCAAVSALECSGLVNAGCGSHSNEDGDREADACVVTGAGAVGCVAATRSVDGGGNGPVAQAARLARAGIDNPAQPAVVAGGGGGAAATTTTTTAAVSAGQDGVACDTVGAVAFWDGCAAAAVSSGGPVGKRRGRVGEAGVPGAGCWATGAGTAAALSGRGEDAVRELLAARLCFAADDAGGGGGGQAAWQAAAGGFAKRRGAPCGGVVLCCDGGEDEGGDGGGGRGRCRVSAFYNTQGFGVGFLDDTGARGELVLRRAGLAESEWCSVPSMHEIHSLPVAAAR